MSTWSTLAVIATVVRQDGTCVTLEADWLNGGLEQFNTYKDLPTTAALTRMALPEVARERIDSAADGARSFQVDTDGWKAMVDRQEQRRGVVDEFGYASNPNYETN